MWQLFWMEMEDGQKVKVCQEDMVISKVVKIWKKYVKQQKNWVLTAHPGRLLGGTLEFNGHHVENMTEKEMRKR